MIVLIDYGVGNLYSVAKAAAFVGGDVKISSAAEDIKRADKIILPGVGAFGDAADKFVVVLGSFRLLVLDLVGIYVFVFVFHSFTGKFRLSCI